MRAARSRRWPQDREQPWLVRPRAPGLATGAAGGRQDEADAFGIVGVCGGVIAAQPLEGDGIPIGHGASIRRGDAGHSPAVGQLSWQPSWWDQAIPYGAAIATAATHLVGRDLDRAVVLEGLLRGFDRWYSGLATPIGRAELHDHYRAIGISAIRVVHDGLLRSRFVS